MSWAMGVQTVAQHDMAIEALATLLRPSNALLVLDSSDAVVGETSFSFYNWATSLAQQKG
jgi:hypothetical protein